VCKRVVTIAFPGLDGAKAFEDGSDIRFPFFGICVSGKEMQAVGVAIRKEIKENKGQ